MDERNHKLIIQYDGRPFQGWQIQENGPTVQGEIEKALAEIWGERISLHGSGRTDSGVHARGQVANFHAREKLPPRDLQRALNAHLPQEIRIRSMSYAAADFHSQFSAVEKTYRYLLQSSEVRSPFTPFYVHWIPHQLDLELMRLAAAELTGTHDYTSLMASGSSVKSTVRTVTAIDVKQHGGLSSITVSANGFLRNMVRNIAGLLIETGQGKRDPKEMSSILGSKDRTKAGVTAPAAGLTLIHVRYR